MGVGEGEGGCTYACDGGGGENVSMLACMCACNPSLFEGTVSDPFPGMCVSMQSGVNFSEYLIWPVLSLAACLQILCVH